MTRASTAPGADDGGQTLAATPRAAAEDACDTAASIPFVMAPRPSSPPKVTNASAANTPRAGERASHREPPRPSSRPEPPEPPEPAHLHEPLGPDDPLAPLPFNPYKGNRGVMRAWNALKYSIKGFRVAIREESAFRQELTLAAILVPIGIFVPVEPVERVLLLGSVMLVLIVELLNSSIENAVDRIGLERNELSGRAKDLGSAAVTVALLTCVMAWGLILVPRFGPALLHWLGIR
ncbi:diacylglycerol kinase [Paraburkholderia sp. RG36]|uniref:Diacylglycerol kinase n=2 Tax=Paraburkholderia tagetis TaxID=2913261 RepID=A0A9X1UM20_9BURK|nr:diacylglycerol kinase [Paraburkholderia tagetis]MCG5077879.1 diacylglycerol kinase [Paraburkholderia tagetis]